MLSVSDSFKKAIKSQNREIFGYVDIKYQDNNYSTSVEQIPSVLRAFTDDGIVKGSKILKKYATLENNYTLLDGSFMVWNENTVDENGYVSDDVFNDINDNTIVIENSSTTIATKGVTIYFKENLPFDFTVTITDTNNDTFTENITNNKSMVYQYIFDTEKYISQVELNISSVEFPNNRIRISYIDFNLSDLYEGDELVNFDVDEELDLLVESLPINTCSVNINNYPSSYGGNKFDPINPKGITKYLTDNVTIEPYIGVLTETNAIEYVPMGVFYLSDWVSNNDGNVTLSGKSILNKLKGTMLRSNGNFLRAGFTSNTFKTFLNTTTGYDYNFPSTSYTWFHNNRMDTFNAMDYLKLAIIVMAYLFDDYDFRKFYVNRYNTITMNNLNESVVSNIDTYSLLADVEYVTRNRIKTIVLKQTINPHLYRPNNASIEECINVDYTLSSEDEYVYFTCDKPMEWGSGYLQNTVESGTATATLIDYNYRTIFVHVVGTVGSKINIKYYDYVYNSMNDGGTKEIRITNSTLNNGDTISLDLTSTISSASAYVDSVSRAYDFSKLYFGLDKPYKVSAKTIGDPSLEIGDTIAIQTRYTDINDGYKNIIITKQHFSFDGGLQCDIEGLGD